METQYSYMEMLEWIEKKGIEIYGESFRILEEDYPVIFKLIAYFRKDRFACGEYGINLSKGIMLAGPIGCGKTSLMSILKFFAMPDAKYSVKSCREVSFEFIQDGYGTIHKYSVGKLYESAPKIICFDDLGIENNLKYFGNECNVMAEILLSRYDVFISKKIPTHITTNLSASEIEQQYGNRVRSRLRELCNLIAFDNAAADKRK